MRNQEKERCAIMFNMTAYNNPYLRPGQSTFQAVLSLRVDDTAAQTPAPLTLAIALDRSGSMDGAKIRAARDGAMNVVQLLDPDITFMIVAFNDSAQVIFGPAQGTPQNKTRAIAALQRIHASHGTCMSSALNAIVERIGQDASRANKILFLTDGKNEGETRPVLQRAVERCRATNISISAWGVGTSWDAAELLYMAEATHGSADIIPTPQQIAAAFTSSFREMRKTAVTQSYLRLWSPVGVKITSFSQVFPSIVPLALEPDATNARQQIVGLGALGAGEQRDFLLDLEVPANLPGQQFMMLRPSIVYFTGGTQPVEEKSTRDGWVFVQWTQDLTLAAQIETHIAHYTNQEELARTMKEGHAALAAGDRAKATALLGQALDISVKLRNDRITRLLSEIVHKEADGTVRLNQQANEVARKTLAINTGRTSRLS